MLSDSLAGQYRSAGDSFANSATVTYTQGKNSDLVEKKFGRKYIID